MYRSIYIRSNEVKPNSTFSLLHQKGNGPDAADREISIARTLVHRSSIGVSCGGAEKLGWCKALACVCCLWSPKSNKAMWADLLPSILSDIIDCSFVAVELSRGYGLWGWGYHKRGCRSFVWGALQGSDPFILQHPLRLLDVLQRWWANGSRFFAPLRTLA